uniref:Uncharacterized protein n=1 Tax=Ascaris lumbricoides TaxID=6252 RepID=A0A9J2PJG9_ASCLU
MLYENTYIVDESPINRNNDCYHSPMFSRNEFSEAKAKQQRLRNLDTREDSFTTQQIHRRRRKHTSFAEPNKTDKRQRHVTIDIEDMSEDDSGCEEGAATFRGTNTNYIDGRKSRMGSRERDEQQSVHDHSTSPIPFSPPVPVLLTKEGSMHESNHPVRQLIARLKPLQLTTTSSHGRSKHNSRFNEAAVKNAGVHLLRKSSELKEENYEKAVPLQDAEYVWRKKRSWSLRSSTYNTRSQSKRQFAIMPEQFFTVPGQTTPLPGQNNTPPG